MKLFTAKIDGTTVVRVNGDLDSDTNPILKEHLKDVIDDVERGLVIDMTEVKYINSAALGIFIQAYRLLSERDIEMKFFGMTRKVKSIFLITKLDGVLSIYDNEAEALESVSGETSEE